MMFLPQENKCKVLEIVLHDLERNQCKMMALICFRMLTRCAYIDQHVHCQYINNFLIWAKCVALDGDNNKKVGEEL